jgi:hypothetical protein
MFEQTKLSLLRWAINRKIRHVGDSGRCGRDVLADIVMWLLLDSSPNTR